MARSRAQSQSKSKRRNEDTRDKNVASERKLNISFSFEHFRGVDSKGVGQTWDQWHSEGLIVPLLMKLQHLSSITPDIANSEKTLSRYGQFPAESFFTCPEELKGKNWGSIRKLGSGGKVRVAGFYGEHNVFYIVFLDKDHQFWPTEN